MPLTPEDVSNKRFTPTRLTQGYDMGEVDQFLDEVESELARLLSENKDLRDKVAALPSTRVDGTGTDDVDTHVETPAPATDQSAPEAQAAPAATAPVEAAAPTPALPSETIKVTTVSDASSAAARLLELATRSADELVGEARAEAERIVGEARTSSQQLEAQSRDRADQLESDARSQSEQLEAETAERRRLLFSDLDSERQSLAGEVENLRSFEREYRARLKTYFEQQLSALDGSGEGGLLTDAPPA